MSDFGSSLEQYGPRHEMSGRASKADLRRRIANLEEENDRLRWQRDKACEFVAGYANRAIPHDPPLTAGNVLADIERDWEDYARGTP